MTSQNLAGSAFDVHYQYPRADSTHPCTYTEDAFPRALPLHRQGREHGSLFPLLLPAWPSPPTRPQGRTVCHVPCPQERPTPMSPWTPSVLALQSISLIAAVRECLAVTTADMATAAATMSARHQRCRAPAAKAACAMTAVRPPSAAHVGADHKRDDSGMREHR